MDSVDKGRMTIGEWLRSGEATSKKARIPANPMLRIYQALEALAAEIDTMKTPVAKTAAAPKVTPKKDK